VQTGVPPELLGHLLPQVLQLFTSELRLISQPFAKLLSQFPNPLLHVMPQLPLVQVAVPFVELQALLQPPQCAVFEFLLTSHPLAGLPSQSA